MLTQVTQVDTPSVILKRGRCWCFTFNNYNDNDIEKLKIYFDTNIYVIGKEIGEQGTKHLQGCVKFENARTFQSLKKAFPTVHWETTRNWEASINYCKKEKDFITNIIEKQTLEEKMNIYKTNIYSNIKWKEWQEQILQLVNTEPDSRSIWWYWENTGNVGKTFLTRYLTWKYKTIVINGKQNDIFNGIKTYLDSKQDYPEIIICDIPRTNENYVCYSTLEKIKDGIFYSGKYEGGICELLPCHVICMANFEPDVNKMSLDRWHIKKI